MIKVITGIRRCGKSFLLFTIFKRYLPVSYTHLDVYKRQEETESLEKAIFQEAYALKDIVDVKK